MSISNRILIVDVNVIIHLEKVGLLDKLIKDENIRIVDLVLYQEYMYKRNSISSEVEKIKQVHLNENQMYEAQYLYDNNSRNSIFDYYSYIVARDNNFILLTSDWKLKRYANDVEVHGVIWYVQKLREKGIINNSKLKEIYEKWLHDPNVFISSEILSELIIEIDREEQLVNN